LPKGYNKLLITWKHKSRLTQIRFKEREFVMAFHFLSHSWEVKNLDDGILVAISQQELNASTIADLDEELFELARESGQSNLYVDLREVRFLPSAVVDKLINLDAMLRTMDGRLILRNLHPTLNHLGERLGSPTTC
jgi:anti-anti-sigma regulatory factor